MIKTMNRLRVVEHRLGQCANDLIRIANDLPPQQAEDLKKVASQNFNQKKFIANFHDKMFESEVERKVGK